MSTQQVSEFKPLEKLAPERDPIASSYVFTNSICLALSGFRNSMEKLNRQFPFAEEQPERNERLAREIDGFQTECLERIRTIVADLID